MLDDTRLTTKIEAFLSRKEQQFPELKTLEHKEPTISRATRTLGLSAYGPAALR